MILVFYFFAAILIALSVKSMLGGFEYLRFFRDRLGKTKSDFTPFTTIIAPCKGLDPGLDQNLKSLFDQQFLAFQIIFVIDDEFDPSAITIRETIAKNDIVPAKLIIAPKATRSSQKIANLLEALKHASPESQAYVFVDSDARPCENWLRSLIAPLESDEVGAATGYRWFVAEKPSIVTELRSAWNASIATALGPNTKSNFCWGGSMAIRRDIFEQLKIADVWSGALSDDFAVTRAVKSAGMKIEFVPAALTASIENCTFREMLEFTTRQMKITRVYSPDLWLLSWFGSALFCSIMLAAAVIAVVAGGFAFIAAITTLVLVSACSIGKAWLRSRAVELVLTKYKRELISQRKCQLSLWLFTPAIFLYNSVAAALSRRLKWRGTTYELKSPSETVIIAD